MCRAPGVRWDENMNYLRRPQGVIWNTGLVMSALPVANAMRGKLGLAAQPTGLSDRAIVD
ncbi:hypothetical protein YTPLAS18_40590 [Nitrospira sp.]|nr:hypothetical protein YTPLAS18_40590 [Nitrospira sp.]